MNSEQENKARYLRFYEGAINDKNYALIGDIVSPQVVSHDAYPGQPPGPEGLKQTFEVFHKAFPDLHAEAQVVIAGGDMVAARFRVSGTHTGEFMGLAGTGKPIAYTEAVFVRFEDGMIVEHWAVADVTELMAEVSG